jgi:hypothetical protein
LTTVGVVTADREDAFTLVFVGYADPRSTDRAVAFEDAVLPILADHGAREVETIRELAPPGGQ